MKKTLSIILILLLVQSVIYSQLLDSKLNFYASYGKTMSIGNSTITEGSYTTPSLFNNFNKANNLDFKALYKWKSHISVGLGFKASKFSDWQNSSSNLFSGSEAKIMALGPVFSLHTKYRKEKLFNRFYASANLFPTYNHVKVDLEHCPYQVDGVENQNDLLHSETSNFGFCLSLQAAYQVNQTLGFFISGGYGFTPLNSQLYEDDKLNMIDLNIGISIVLVQYKHYRYD